jgi:ABC-type antimicrobial peptide transport system permease subunit
VLADSVSRRTREFGIRRAVGAQTADILRHVGLDALRLTAVGFAIGIPLTVAVIRWIATLLLNNGPSDLSAFATAASGCILIAGLATAVPGIRAIRIEPAEALRDD